MSLLDGSFGPANQELRLALDPEVRRIVCQVREDCNERAAWKGGSEAFPEGTVKMWNYRDPPCPAESGGQKPLSRSTDELWYRRMTIWRNRMSEGCQVSSHAEHLVIQVLDSNAGNPSEKIQGVKYFLKVTSETSNGRPCFSISTCRAVAALRCPPPASKKTREISALAGPWAGAFVCHLC